MRGSETVSELQTELFHSVFLLDMAPQIYYKTIIFNI